MDQSIGTRKLEKKDTSGNTRLYITKLWMPSSEEMHWNSTTMCPSWTNAKA